MKEDIPPNIYYDDELNTFYSFYSFFEFYGLPAKTFEHIGFTKKWIDQKDKFPRLPKTQKIIS